MNSAIQQTQTAPERLRVEDVRYCYPGSDWELEGVSLALQAGEMLAVIGPNGSGKSTLLQLAAGVLTPASGSVLLETQDMAGLDRRAVARALGYLPQEIRQTFDYTVEEIVSMGRFPHLSGLGFLSAEDIRVVETSLEQTETLAYRKRQLSHLSGGERQRVFLASVLAQEPRVLLLDEPTAALDIHHQARFFRLLRQLATDGMAVAVVTHDLNVASFHCNRLFLMKSGSCAKDGAAHDVLQAGVLSEVYGESIVVDRDNRTGKPVVLPIAACDRGAAEAQQ